MKEDQLIEDWIFNYFSGQLSEAEAARLCQWIEADEANKKYFAEKADGWATAHVPYFRLQMKDNFQKQFGNLPNSANPVKGGRFGNRGGWMKAAASVFIVFSVGLLGYYVGKNQTAQPARTAGWFETSVPLGSQSKVVLPDLSVVWINAGSSLKYSEDFHKQSREVSLSGEAYFEVATDSVKPFVVRAEKLDIKVVGTRFNVKAYQDEETVDVALVTGKVKVHLNDREPEEGLVTLTPDRLLSYNKETNCVQVKKINGLDAYAWTNGQLKFDQLFFPQIAKCLERKFDVRIIIKSESLEKEIFSGSFSFDYSLNKILQEIDVDKKYTWTRKDNNVVIKDRN